MLINPAFTNIYKSNCQISIKCSNLKVVLMAENEDNEMGHDDLVEIKHEETKKSKEEAEATHKETPKTGKKGVSKKWIGIGAIIAVVVIALIGLSFTGMFVNVNPNPTNPNNNNPVTFGSGAATGDTVNVSYVGKFTNGTEFDSGDTQFEIGSGQMITGFENAVIGMKDGEEKTVTLQPKDAYGEYDSKNIIAVPLVQESNKTIETSMTAAQFNQVFGEDPVVGETYQAQQMEWPVKLLSFTNTTVKLLQMPEDGQIIQLSYGTTKVTVTDDKIIMKLTPVVGSSIETYYGEAKIISANETHMNVDFNNPMAGKTLVFTIKVLKVTKPATFEKPNVKFFTMAYCPYGNQAESGLEPVYRSLGDKVDWEPHYVIYSNYGSGYPAYCLDEESKYCSMHGVQELNEDVRELCMWKFIDHSKWWDFLMKVNTQCTSQNVDTCWEPIAKGLGIDTEKIKTCQKDEAVTLLENEISLNEEFSVRGSPTVLINDKAYNGGRTPDNYKQAICDTFSTKPTECGQTLGSTATNVSGSCG